MIAKRIGVLLVAVTLVTSGAYVLVYLQRWEWNRALVAGIFMLASEMILVAAALAARIRAVERKVTAAVDRTQQERVLCRLREAPAPSRDHFAWLRPTGTGTSVFVPVLMGAGLVLSGLAWIVERVAKATAGSAMERGLATRLVAFSVPEEPLVEPDTDPLALGVHTILLRPGERAMKRVLLGLLGAALAVALVMELMEMTQNRHDTDRHDGSSTIVLSVSTKRGFDRELAAHSLWAACQPTVLANRLVASTPQADGGHVAVLAVEPALGEHAQRRLVGCLEDATVDLVSAHVVSVSS